MRKIGVQRPVRFGQYAGKGPVSEGPPWGRSRARREGPMGSETRRQLQQALEFEQKQLAILERQVAGKPLTDPVQIANWPRLVASHQRAIAFYQARLADLDGTRQ